MKHSEDSPERVRTLRLLREQLAVLLEGLQAVDEQINAVRAGIPVEKPKRKGRQSHKQF